MESLPSLPSHRPSPFCSLMMPLCHGSVAWLRQALPPSWRPVVPGLPDRATLPVWVDSRPHVLGPFLSLSTSDLPQPNWPAHFPPECCWRFLASESWLGVPCPSVPISNPSGTFPGGLLRAALPLAFRGPWAPHKISWPLTPRPEYSLNFLLKCPQGAQPKALFLHPLRPRDSPQCLFQPVTPISLPLPPKLCTCIIKCKQNISASQMWWGTPVRQTLWGLGI